MPLSKPTHAEEGRNRALRGEEEKFLVDVLVHPAQRGVPLSQHHLRQAEEIIVGRMPPARRLLLLFSISSPGPAFIRSIRHWYAKSIRFSKLYVKTPSDSQP